MSSIDRRSAGRRRAWGRGPVVLRLESLDRRELLASTGGVLPDLVAASFVTTSSADWNDSITASGQIKNQGRRMVTTPFNVAIYASSSSTLGRKAVPIGQVTIPAGLEPGQSVPFTTTVSLPTSPLPGMNPNGTVTIGLKVDPERTVREGNKRNNTGLGLGYDIAKVQIAPKQTVNLVSTAIGVYPTAPEWGQQMSVSAQVSNESYGTATPTRARIVLTPHDQQPGGISDVTIGEIQVPAINPWSTVNVEGTVTLPVTPPALLSSTTGYILSIVPDADYVTDPTYPRVAHGGLGVDQVAININVPAGTTPPVLENLPNLAPGTVTPSASNLYWGKSFQVQTSVQNLGVGDSGAFRVRYLLVGSSGDPSNGLFLGDTWVDGVPSQGTIDVTTTLTLPSRLPYTMSMSSQALARVAVLVDPENTVNETFKNNNLAASGPVTLRLQGTDGTSYVPNAPAPNQLLEVNRPATVARNESAAQAAANHATNRRLFRRPPAEKSAVVKNLTSFSDKVTDFFKGLF